MRSGTQRDERRRRFLAKQEPIAAGMPLHHKSNQNVTTTTPLWGDDDTGNSADTLWIDQHNHMCKAVTLDKINLIKRYRMISEQNISDSNDGESNVEEHDTLSQEILFLDRFLSPYFDLQHNDLPSSKNKHDQRLRFIAEGTETVRLLIQQQYKMRDRDDVSSIDSFAWHEPIQIESVFMKQTLFFDQPVHIQDDVDIILRTMQERLPEQKHETQSPPPFQVLLASTATMSAVAGFAVSRGCLACGYIPINRTEECFFEKLNRHFAAATTTTTETFRLLALDEKSLSL